MFQADKEQPVTSPAIKHKCLPRWRGRIAGAIIRGHFSEEERDLAENWDTCAIGEAKFNFGFHIANTPSMMGYGQDFYRAVKANKFKLANSILDAIEEQLNEVTHVVEDDFGIKLSFT